MRSDNSRPVRPVIFGEILFDHFFDGSQVLGGAPFNVAWHLHAFGLQPLMISRIGTDPEGQGVLAAMQRWGMDTSAIQIDARHPTGKVNVTLVDGEPEYEIAQYCAYDFIDGAGLPTLPAKALLYHGTLALRDATSRAALATLKRAPVPDCFLDINLRPPFWSRATLVEGLQAVKLLKVNESELGLLTHELALVDSLVTVQDRMQAVFDHLRLEQLIVTLGAEGVRAMDASGVPPLHLPLDQISEVVDTVGAGDAFSSVLLLGRCLQWPLALSVSRAQRFASSIVGVRGATVGDRNFYQPFRLDWQLE